MKILRLAVALWLVTAGTVVAQPTFDAAEEGRKAVERLIKGDFAGFAAGFDEKMRAALPEEKLRRCVGQRPGAGRRVQADARPSRLDQGRVSRRRHPG